MERQTAQKKLIEDTVMSMHNHPTADEVYADIVKKFPSVSKVTVYRNLKLLAACGKIRRVEVPGAADRFDFNTSNHYHMSCRSCGKVFDVPLDYIDLVAAMSGAASGGFMIDDHDIIFKGYCPECNIKRKTKKEDIN